MISVVIPVFNEIDSLESLLGEIIESVPNLYEVIFVDDGSTDGSREILQKMARENQLVRLIEHPRNLGKSAAYVNAFGIIEAELVVTLDADLQDVPSEIPKMVQALGDYDMVVGWKQGRFANEPTKAIPSKVFNSVLTLMFGLKLHDSNCGFRLMRRSVARSLILTGDSYRFIPQIAHMQGFKVKEFPVHHRKRQFGRTKYGPSRFWTGLLDVISLRFVSKYYEKPMQFFGTLGLAPLALGVFLEVYVLVMKYLFHSTFQVHVAAILAGILLILAGLQCILTGLVGEMILHSRVGTLYSTINTNVLFPHRAEMEMVVPSLTSHNKVLETLETHVHSSD